MGVPDLEPAKKEPGVRCQHVCSRGCRIYEARPSSCSEFECVWLQGALPRFMRPDKIGIVFVQDPSRDDRFLGHVDLAVKNGWAKNEALTRALAALGRAGIEIALGLTGSGRITHRFTREGLQLRPAHVPEPTRPA